MWTNDTKEYPVTIAIIYIFRRFKFKEYLHILQGKLSEVATIISALCILIYIEDCQLF